MKTFLVVFATAAVFAQDLDQVEEDQVDQMDQVEDRGGCQAAQWYIKSSDAGEYYEDGLVSGERGCPGISNSN